MAKTKEELEQEASDALVAANEKFAADQRASAEEIRDAQPDTAETVEEYNERIALVKGEIYIPPAPESVEETVEEVAPVSEPVQESVEPVVVPEATVADGSVEPASPELQEITKAGEKIDAIKQAGSAEEIDTIVGDDVRPTVVTAAAERKAEIGVN